MQKKPKKHHFQIDLIRQELQLRFLKPVSMYPFEERFWAVSLLGMFKTNYRNSKKKLEFKSQQ
jgi:hypothetical protein